MYTSPRSTATAGVCSFLWNPAAFSQMYFPALSPPCFLGSTFLLSKSWAIFLATISIHSACYGPFPLWGLAWGNYMTNPWEPVLLRSCLPTVWRARSCYLLTGSWCLSIWPGQDQELHHCSVLKVLQWIPDLWSGRHSSRLLLGFCPALSRLLSFHPDCLYCSAGRSVWVVLGPFPC